MNDYRQMKTVEAEKLKLEAEKDEISQTVAQLKKVEVRCNKETVFLIQMQIIKKYCIVS